VSVSCFVQKKIYKIWILVRFLFLRALSTNLLIYIFITLNTIFVRILDFHVFQKPTIIGSDRRTDSK